MLKTPFFFRIARFYQRSFLFPLVGKLRRVPPLVEIPADPWPGDMHSATLLLDRYAPLVESSCSRFWSHGEVKDVVYFHTFEWLRDLKTIGDSRSRRFCRHVIMAWIRAHRGFKGMPWSYAVAAERLSNFFCYYEFFAQSAEDRFLRIFHRVLLKHMRFLRFYALRLPSSFEAVLALKAVVLGGLSFQKQPSSLAPLLSRLSFVLTQILYSDGFFYKEHPDLQVRLSRHLIDLRNFLRQCGDPSAALKIQQFINRTIPPIRLLRHGDGALSKLCGESLIPSPMVDVVLSLSDVRSRQPQKSEHAGFERLSLDQQLILIKTKKTSFIKRSTGNLHFEWSYGKDRLLHVCDVILESKEGKSYQGHGVPKVYKRSEHDERFIELLLHNDDFTQHREMYLGKNGDLRVCDHFKTALPSFGALRLLIDQSFSVQIASHHRTVLLQNAKGSSFRLDLSNVDEVSLDTKESFLFDTQSLYLLFQLLPGVERTISWSIGRY